jgi:excisionase family DNA binding protein
MTILLTPEEAAKELRIGRSRMYEMLRRGDVLSVKVGGSRRVPYEALQAYVRRLVDEQRSEQSA